MSDPRRFIPSVDSLLGDAAFERVLSRWSRDAVVSAVRRVQGRVREQATSAGAGAGDPRAAGTPDPGDAGWYADAATALLEARERGSVRRVLNGTGVILHTNLGRAPLAEAARAAMLEAAGYAALEVDLETGERGSRHDHCVDLLRELTGAEAALVVNNNAAAVLLALNTLAAGREAVVSRGELVEIGGSFRVPAIMERSGARLRELGSTNRTHLADYEDAVDSGTGVILKVHRSNFRMEGYTADVDPRALAELASSSGVPLLNDLGSGLLVDLREHGLPPEPTAGMALAAGADVVTLSGDKLLGGPQAGIILGSEALVSRMRANPMSRALRPDKLILAGLEATLRLYRDGRALREVPVLRMLTTRVTDLRSRADQLAERLGLAGLNAAVVESTATVGGGAFPGAELPSMAVRLSLPRGTGGSGAAGGAGPDALARALRLGEPAVVARIHEGALLLDLRTLGEGEEAEVATAVASAVEAVTAGGDGAEGSEADGSEAG